MSGTTCTTALRTTLLALACLFLLWVVQLALPAWVSAQETSALRLVTDHQPPYVVVTPWGVIEGTVTDIVRRTLQQMGVPFTIRVYPWKRAQAMALSGHADGFFAASQSERRDLTLAFSMPLAAQRWTWVLPANSRHEPGTAEFMTEARVSAFKGSNMQAWLESGGFRVSPVPPDDYKALISFLEAGRIDAALGGHLGIREELERRGILDSYRLVHSVDRPVGVYFSKAYIAAHPDFLDAFNRIARRVLSSEGIDPMASDDTAP